MTSTSSQPGWLSPLITSLGLLGIVAWIDYITGWEVSLALFYSAPILTAVWLGDRKTAYAIAALCCPTWLCTDILNGHPYSSIGLEVWEIFIRAGFFFAVAFAGVAVKDRQQALAARIEALGRLRGLERQIGRLTEHENQRIGRELHDGLCQYLAAIACATTSLKMDLERHALPEPARLAAEIETLLAESVNQARDLSRGLAPVSVDEGGLAASLQELAAATTRRTGIDCHFEAFGDGGPVLNGKATHLYRIAQEAIENAKHGKARTVEVRMSANPTAISVSIADDGVGFRRSEEIMQQPGIEVMQYRAALAGGEFEIEERASGGTIVSCTVAMSA